MWWGADEGKGACTVVEIVKAIEVFRLHDLVVLAYYPNHQQYPGGAVVVFADVAAAAAMAAVETCDIWEERGRDPMGS